MADAFTIYNEGFNAGLKPDPLLNISEWADKYRVLSQKASAEPGKWRTSRTPYLKEIMDCLSPYSGIERVVFMKGAQIGGTEVGNNFLGYIVHLSPGPIMLVMPTVDGAKRTSKTRIDPMFAAIPELKGVISDRRSKDASNTTLMKEFQGGVLVLTGANSAIGLRSMPVRYIFLDEIDAYKGDVEGEGDPVNLAIKRTSTFSFEKIYRDIGKNGLNEALKSTFTQFNELVESGGSAAKTIGQTLAVAVNTASSAFFLLAEHADVALTLIGTRLGSSAILGGINLLKAGVGYLQVSMAGLSISAKSAVTGIAMMSRVSKLAAVQMGVTAAAAGILKGALALIGGPAGLCPHYLPENNKGFINGQYGRKTGNRCNTGRNRRFEMAHDCPRR